MRGSDYYCLATPSFIQHNHTHCDEFMLELAYNVDTVDMYTDVALVQKLVQMLLCWEFKNRYLLVFQQQDITTIVIHLITVGQ